MDGTHIEKAVAIGIMMGDPAVDSDEQSFQELRTLAKQINLDIVHVMTQNLEKINNEFFIGKGKAHELAEYCKAHDIESVVFDNELTPSHIRNLEELLDIDVYDRSLVIIKIFAKHAKTAEGKMQVKLAEQTYLLPRLTGSNKHLSRLVGGAAGAGSAMRGPGESKLEHQKRVAKTTIAHLKREIEELKRTRQNARVLRKKNDLQQIAIIGYTNAGKSTLLNCLTDAGVLSEDNLFVTLDPTAKSLSLPDGSNVIMIDTVGFIRKLPTNLIKAFASTLEEATLADMILHVADASSPDLERNLAVVNDMLVQLKAEHKPILTVFNKMDKVENEQNLPHVENCLGISCKTGYNMDLLLHRICGTLPEQRYTVTVTIPYKDGKVLGELRKVAMIKEEKHLEEGTEVTAVVDKFGIAILRQLDV